MVRKNRTPIYSEDDDSFLGFVVSDGTTWQATTIFGYLISRTQTENQAIAVLRDVGPMYLKGTWQYYDKDDHDWFTCVIKKAYERQVIVNRTNTLGFQDPDDYKQIVIENPTENDLIKST